MKIPEPRKEIRDFIPYTAGRSIEEIKKVYGLKEVVKLASNENLLGTSAKAIKAVKKEMASLCFYPQPRNSRFIEKIASLHSVREDMVIIGNGTDEIIELIAKTFLSPRDNIVVS
ncbi:MAG: aminotransferase class I/II-fold pyridoxal phosphate-dependent enzyme, partial [Elusimicrobiota bacterium]|nr:aminotransferase class I/II-fold pyridoxal phosphate-dependent enzyme [Elusimicrobiota bacterium]